MIKKKSTLADLDKAKEDGSEEDLFELQDTNLWMKSEQELNNKWEAMYQDVIPEDIFVQAKLNTLVIWNSSFP